MSSKSKSPLLVRTQDKINLEYSDIVNKLGVMEIEMFDITRRISAGYRREEEITKQKTEYMERIKQLSEEMQASIEEANRKARVEAAKAAETTPAIESVGVNNEAV
jgi:gas vesicle protein